VRRLAHLLLVGLLVANLGGVVSLLVPEPCGPNEGSAAPHSTCPPTCARCGCCGQPVVTALIVTVGSAVVRIDQPPVPALRIVSVDPREILHVPRAA
jgi:hypothetical protein